MAATGEGPGYGTGASVFERDADAPPGRIDRLDRQRLTLHAPLDSVPAEVAMRSGMLPSQQRALRRAFKKADAFDHFRTRTRRAFFGLFGLSALGASAAYWLGQRTASEPAASATNSVASELETLALGPLDALEQAHPLLIAYLDLHTADAKPKHWLGLERLAFLALSEPETKRALGREVTRLVDVRGCPAATRPVIDKLRTKLR